MITLIAHEETKFLWEVKTALDAQSFSWGRSLSYNWKSIETLIAKSDMKNVHFSTSIKSNRILLTKASAKKFPQFYDEISFQQN